MAKALRFVSLQSAVSNGALDGKELPSRIKVLSWGANTTQKGTIYVDESTARQFAANQKEIARERAAIDYNHNTIKGTEAYKALEGRPPVIFGYGTPRIIPGDGIWFEDIQWTPEGEKQARNFIDLSPAVALDPDSRVTAVESCALTPAGAVDGLTFYSAFASLETFAAGTPLTQTTEPIMEANSFNYFRKACKLAADSSDDDVRKHVMKHMAAAFSASDEDKEGKETMKHLSAVIGMAAPPAPQAPIMTPTFTAELEKAVTPLTATITALRAEIDGIKTAQTTQVATAQQAEKDALIAQAGKDGKVIPLSAETIKTLSVEVVREMVKNAKPAAVPTARRALRPLNADGSKPKASMADGARAIDEQIAASQAVRPMQFA